MATKDPSSRLTEGNLNSPYASPNGLNERGNAGGMSSDPTTARRDVGPRQEESPGEKIGRFFRRAMERIAGRDDDDWRRRDEERARRDRELYRTGEASWQSGRSALRDRGQSEWSDVGRSRDDRSPSYRAGPSGDTTGSHERLSGGQQGSGNVGYGQGTTGRPYGQGQSNYQPDQSRLGSSAGQSQSYESRGGERGFQGEMGRDDWNRGAERWGERGSQSGASGLSAADAGSGASFGFVREEQRLADWGEMARDRDVGQGRRFWQREPLAARDVMTRNPKTVARGTPMREAAVIMRDENCGVVPVVDAAGRLEGILTDRDIVVRGVIEVTGDRRIEDLMTDDVSAVTEDEPLTSVLDLMGRRQIRRVPVVDRNDRLLGIISMADIANRADYDEDLQDAFERISSRRSFWSLFS